MVGREMYKIYGERGSRKDYFCATTHRKEKWKEQDEIVTSRNITSNDKEKEELQEKTILEEFPPHRGGKGGKVFLKDRPRVS